MRLEQQYLTENHTEKLEEMVFDCFRNFGDRSNLFDCFG